jgi:hypothetical protein
MEAKASMRVGFSFSPPLTRPDKPDQYEFIMFSGTSVGNIIDDVLQIVQKNRQYVGKVEVASTETTPEFTLEFKEQ